jgi:hypothetical protein
MAKELKTKKTWQGRNSLTGEVVVPEVREIPNNMTAYLEVSEDGSKSQYAIYHDKKEITRWNTKQIP